MLAGIGLFVLGFTLVFLLMSVVLAQTSPASAATGSAASSEPSRTVSAKGLPSITSASGPTWATSPG
jgi:Na+-transporting methylmalonyl-CoA/oxaloacetate decarboxylase gamma subunit